MNDQSSAADAPLDGRVALVTGGSRGIGRAIAVELGETGADVAVGYRSRGDAAEETCAAIEAVGRRAVPIRADVSDPEELDRLVATTERELGAVDVLINNAGIARQRAVEDVTVEDWDDHLATNLTSAFRLTKAVLPGMRERGWGRIVNVSSVAARNGGIIGPHYAASKAGMIGLTRGYAGRLAGEGITVNAVAPGLVETEMVADSSADPSDVPVGRFGEPEETAALVGSLVRNGYVTGQTVNVDGGIRFD